EKSETSYAARFANSWCSPTRLTGTFFAGSNFSFKSPGSSLSQAPFVGNGPGAMALKRMPYFAHSTAKERVIANTPAFAVALGTTYAEPVKAYVVTIFKTVLLVSFFSIQCFPNASVQFFVPFKTMSIIVSKAFAESLSVGEMKFPAAL